MSSSVLISPSSVLVSPDQGVMTAFSTTAPRAAIAPSRYAIELRDKNFKLKGRLEAYVDGVSWEWNRIGGYGRATFKINGDYKRFEIGSDDDVRIYLPNQDGGASLWYRGYVESATHSVASGNKGMIQVECTGYFSKADRKVVKDDGSPLVYENMEVSLIVRSLIQTFLVPGGITIGSIDAGSFTPDAISFKTSLKEALKTCFDLLGVIEYGVDENLRFYWYTQSEDLRHVFHLGDKVSKLSDRFDFKNILNRIYFEGGEVNGTVFVTRGQSQSSINRNGEHEEIVSNGSIYTSSVASQLITSILRQRSFPQRQLSIGLKNTKKRLELSLPIGACAIVDPDSNQTGAVYGSIANGGSGKVYGRVIAGGSGQVYGGLAKHQVDRIQYSLSPQDGRVNAEIQFGNSLGHSKASATLKRMELLQSALRQGRL